jgi:hypothetical protein
MAKIKRRKYNKTKPEGFNKAEQENGINNYKQEGAGEGGNYTLLKISTQYFFFLLFPGIFFNFF